MHTPPHTQQVQRYVRFGAVGLIVCSSTRLEDVPAADTFSVEDAMSVSEWDALHFTFITVDGCIYVSHLMIISVIQSAY